MSPRGSAMPAVGWPGPLSLCAGADSAHRPLWACAPQLLLTQVPSAYVPSVPWLSWLRAPGAGLASPHGCRRDSRGRADGENREGSSAGRALVPEGLGLGHEQVRDWRVSEPSLASSRALLSLWPPRQPPGAYFPFSSKQQPRTPGREAHGHPGWHLETLTTASRLRHTRRTFLTYCSSLWGSLQAQAARQRLPFLRHGAENRASLGTKTSMETKEAKVC